MTGNGQERSSGVNGVETKRTKLEFSGWDLCPYILLHGFVHICIGSTDDCSRIFRILVA